jgi:Carboxypeptidase regulatory-like domain
MFNKRVVVVAVALACLFAVLPTGMYAQTAGTVDGLVTDTTGAAVGGATITLTDKATGIPLTTTSNQAGRYVFVNVTPGVYSLTVSKTGFRVARMADQKVTVGMELALNVTLEVGTMSQTVEVKVAVGAELQTENAAMGSTVSNDMLLAMPNLNRDATSLLTLQPATAPYAPGGGDVYGGQVAGSLSDQNTYMLDGGNITSDLEGDNNYTNNGIGGRGAIPTPLESIEEFKVATNNQTADFFTSAGGQVMLQSKRGGSGFHGSAYEYFQSQLFNANTWDNNRHLRPIVKFHDNRFGGGVGGPLFPGKFLGGKTYFYGFYEGRRFPGTAQTLEWAVPSALMRQGILQWKDPTTGAINQVNLATSTACNVTTTNTTGACDPRGVGISPLVQQFWNKYEPLPNDSNYLSNGADALNVQGYQAALSLPEKEDYGMVRIDHDFTDKWKFFGSYRIYRDILPSTNQIDIGGLLPGDKLGVPASASSNPTLPRYVVAGLTGTITPRLINEFHFSYLLNRWFWQRQGVTNAVSGVPAGIEFADSHYGCLCPLNMDTQDARNRVWDGHDWNYSDTLNWVKGTHYMQFGGTMIHWWDHHVRDDQVVAGLPQLVDQLNKATGLKTSADNRPAGLPSTLNGRWDNQYAETLGIIGTAAQLFVRGGNDFHLTGAKTFADTSIIDSYSLYYNDSWKIRPTLTLNYGLEWGIQMPPYEINGVQDFMVDSSGAILTSQQYLQNTVNQALQGQVYNPVLGFEPIGAVGGHPKYPFQPFYGGFSPRVAVAWNPRFQSGILGKAFGQGKTVFRVGYSRIYDRNNGVDLVLVPLLGYGFGQTIRCNGASISGSCLGGSGTTPATAFRLGVDGTTGPFPAVQQTLPIPAEPGVNSPAGSNISFLDNNWRPGGNDQITIGIQRELPDNIIVEAAWVGKWSKHLYQGLDLNNVPWMMTLGGQSFAKAYANLWNADQAGQTTIAAQPFFENALAGSAYCMGFANCSTAVLANEGAGGTGNISTENVYGVWQDLDASHGGPCPNPSNVAKGCQWTAFRTSLPADLQGYNSMLGNTTLGFSNYQAGILRVQKRTGHGLTLNANLTWSHTLSTVGINQEYTQANPSVPFDLRYDYGPAPFDTRWVFNMLGTYDLPFGKGKWLGTNNGVLDHIIGGWTFAPIFQWNSGLVMETYTGSCDEFGQGNVAWCSGMVPLQGVNVGSISRSAHYGVNATNGVGTDGNSCAAPNICGSGVNLFANPSAVYNMFRPAVLGIDGRAYDLGPLYGQHRWNLDFSIAKTTKITERVGTTFYAQFFNALNHMQFNDPGQYGSGGLNLQSPTSFGVLDSQFGNPRSIEFGLRVFF